MLRAYTIRSLVVGWLAFGWLALSAALAQSQLSWKNLGGTSVSADLAGPVSGPVRRAWYSASGDRLSVETASGRIFETQDFEHWRLNLSGPAPLSLPGLNALIPEGGTRMLVAGNRLYAAGADNIYSSDDAGRSWLNLTGFNNRSVIGGGFHGLAISPANQKELTAVNQQGVWRSLDGGLSWSSLNKDLPNLSARRFTESRTRILLADDSVAELAAGKWTLTEGGSGESLLAASLSKTTGRRITAAERSGSLTYAGSADGRLLVFREGTAGWAEPAELLGTGISRIWVERERPDVALAAAGERVLRTVNGGRFWDDVTGSLKAGTVHGLTADALAGVVYVAADRGVFQARLALNAAGPSAAEWISVSRELPAAIAWDVRLNADGTLSVALDGYGIFETAAPHKAAGVRIVNAADLSQRPAAPGSLITVIGARVTAARDSGPLYPVIAAAQNSSQLQVPFESAAGDVTLALEGAAGRWTVPLSIRDTSPAIFVDSEGAPLLLDAESGLVMDAGVSVHAGSSVALLATGLGRVTPDWPSGIPAPLDAPPRVRGEVTAYLDGMPLEVARATLAPGYVGYYVIELRMPAIVNRGAAELRVVSGGVESNRVRLFVESAPARQ